MRVTGWLSAGARWLAGPAQGHGKTDDDNDKSNAGSLAARHGKGNVGHARSVKGDAARAPLLVQCSYAPLSGRAFDPSSGRGSGSISNIGDRWVESYLTYLENQHQLLDAGEISAHYLRCANGLYAEFKRTSCPRDRFRAWSAIVVVCGWLQQVQQGRERPS
jgi:hypothetical protein